MGKSGESINTTHQQKKWMRKICYIIEIDLVFHLTDKQVKNIEYYKPDENSEEIKYLKDQRIKLVVLFQKDHLLQNK